MGSQSRLEKVAAQRSGREGNRGGEGECAAAGDQSTYVKPAAFHAAVILADGWVKRRK